MVQRSGLTHEKTENGKYWTLLCILGSTSAFLLEKPERPGYYTEMCNI